jgi:hypothetical protein
MTLWISWATRDNAPVEGVPPPPEILYIKETVWGAGWSPGGRHGGRAPDRGDGVVYSRGP